jgi:hypothetical protein
LGNVGSFLYLANLNVDAILTSIIAGGKQVTERYCNGLTCFNDITTEQLSELIDRLLELQTTRAQDAARTAREQQD